MKSAAKKKVLKELANVPIISVAANAAGVSRQTVYRWIKEDAVFAQKLQEQKQEGVEHINDISESQLIAMIKNQNWPVIKYWLSRRHTDYREYRPDEKKERDQHLTEEEVAGMNRMMARFMKVKKQRDENLKKQNHSNRSRRSSSVSSS